MISNGYSRAFENEADAAAVTILKRVGYDPHGLIDMLNIMAKKLKPGALDFAKTHPSPESRIESLNKLIAKGSSPVSIPQVRIQRFETAMNGI
jgi:predicted Zn-dependent protease